MSSPPTSPAPAVLRSSLTSPLVRIPVDPTAPISPALSRSSSGLLTPHEPTVTPDTDDTRAQLSIATPTYLHAASHPTQRLHSRVESAARGDMHLIQVESITAGLKTHLRHLAGNHVYAQSAFRRDDQSTLIGVVHEDSQQGREQVEKLVKAAAGFHRDANTPATFHHVFDDKHPAFPEVIPKDAASIYPADPRWRMLRSSSSGLLEDISSISATPTKSLARDSGSTLLDILKSAASNGAVATLGHMVSPALAVLGVTVDAVGGEMYNASPAAASTTSTSTSPAASSSTSVEPQRMIVSNAETVAAERKIYQTVLDYLLGQGGISLPEAMAEAAKTVNVARSI
ncbi:hypothetical protein BDK51DRAFT_37834 [Blyttiomyces helicus]|uniref:Uncharacterized protein n=1 Tax=Blyttiomyces helicus TaxID=388810 RepID=A0A4P9W242_9FUNG|nr:hypothetical protein BDK51DRAFT_37834 [Blyttiomyces helicus]|eukprot:RKO86279.1 hypothetical protein BDK51DRAFT_37834 [Blyttiomyces helicus]